MQYDKVKNVKLIDFQAVVYGSPVLDLIYFLMSSTLKDLRQKYMNDLFDEYYVSFENFLTLLRCNANVLYPRKIFYQHLKQFGHIGLGVSLFAIAQNENYPFYENKLSNESQRRIERYKTRMNDILDDIIKYFGK